MLDDLLISLMGLQGYRLSHASWIAGKVHLWVERAAGRPWVCPHCGRETFSLHSRWEMSLKERPILGRPTVLHFWHARIRCVCQVAPVAVPLPIQEEGFRVTEGLASAVVEAAREAPLKFVAAHFGLSWNTARDLDLAYLRRTIERRAPVAPNRIGVDEVSYAKGHRYLTVVADQDARRVVFVTQGRRAANLDEFFEKRLDPGAAPWLEAASIDMWDPDERSIRAHAPQAMIVYDPFHVIRSVNDCVDQVRRGEQRALEKEGRKTFKHARWLLLKGQERLRPEQQQSLQDLLSLNRNLQTAYLLKEQFRQLYRIGPEPGDDEAAPVQRAFAYLVEKRRKEGKEGQVILLGAGT